MARTLIASIQTTGSSPYMFYQVYCTPVRIDSRVNYTFELVGKFVTSSGNNSSGSSLGTGSGCYLRWYGWTQSPSTGSIGSNYFKTEGESLSLNNGTTKTISKTVTVDNPSGAALSCDFAVDSGYFSASTFSTLPCKTPAIDSYKTAPTAPTFKSIVAGGVTRSLSGDFTMVQGDSITLTWNPSSNGVNNPVIRYAVLLRRRTLNGSLGNWVEIKNNGMSTSYTFTPGVWANDGQGTVGQLIVVAVTADPVVGNSPWTCLTGAIIQVRKPIFNSISSNPPSQSGVVISLGGDLTLSWSFTALDGYKIIGYDIHAQHYKNGEWKHEVLAFYVSANSSSYTVSRSSINPGDLYNFTIAATCDSSITSDNYYTSSLSTNNFRWAFIPPAPQVPSFSPTGIYSDGSSTITLKHNGIEGDIARCDVMVYRNIGTGWETDTIYNGTSLSFVTTPKTYGKWYQSGELPTPGTRFTYRWRVLSSYGLLSDWSGTNDSYHLVIQPRTPPKPNTPTVSKIGVFPDGDLRVNLSHNGMEGTLKSYQVRVHLSEDKGATWEVGVCYNGSDNSTVQAPRLYSKYASLGTYPKPGTWFVYSCRVQNSYDMWSDWSDTSVGVDTYPYKPSQPGKPLLSASEISGKTTFNISSSPSDPGIGSGVITGYYYQCSYQLPNTSLWSDWKNISFIASNSTTLSASNLSDIVPDGKIQSKTKFKFRLIAENTYKQLEVSEESNELTVNGNGTVRYNINGQWKQCEVYYPVNGQWKQCEVYYPIDNSWKQCE